MKFKKILIIGIDENKLDSVYWDRIKSSSDLIVSLPKDSPDIFTELKDVDCLLVNFGVMVSKQTIDLAGNLKYIGILATAYGKVDFSYAKSKGIVVTNLPGYSTESVAEFIIAVILENIRGLEEGKHRTRNKNYSESEIPAREIKDSNFGVLGLGRIGLRVAELAVGFGAQVIYWSRNRKQEAEEKGIQYTDLEKLLSESDFISINLAQTPETENFLNKDRLQKIKKGAVVVNTAAMELVDLNGLTQRLKEGDITFILDHSDEMSEADLKKLSQYQNCIIYPPIGYITNEARIAKQEMFVGNIEAFLEGKPQNTIN